jgi:hypothetical protein
MLLAVVEGAAKRGAFAGGGEGLTTKAQRHQDGEEKKEVYPQMSQISADGDRGLNHLCSSGSSAGQYDLLLSWCLCALVVSRLN